MLNNKTVANYLCEIKYDIEQDNDVTLQEYWGIKELEVYKALEVVARYLQGE